MAHLYWNQVEVDIQILGNSKIDKMHIVILLLLSGFLSKPFLWSLWVNFTWINRLELPEWNFQNPDGQGQFKSGQVCLVFVRPDRQTTDSFFVIWIESGRRTDRIWTESGPNGDSRQNRDKKFWQTHEIPDKNETRTGHGQRFPWRLPELRTVLIKVSHHSTCFGIWWSFHKNIRKYNGKSRMGYVRETTQRPKRI